MDRHRVEVVQLLAALLVRRHKIGLLENDQVFGHGLPCHREALAQFVQGLSVFGVKPVEQRPSRCIGQGLEHVVHGWRRYATKWLPVKRVFWRSRFAVLVIAQPAQIGFENLGGKNMNRYVKSAICFTSLFVLCGGAHAQSEPKQKITEQKIGAPPEASNMKLVGYNDLQHRSAYQPTIHHQGDRYIAYIGHHGGTPEVPKPLNPLTGQNEFNGTSIVDVTDPAHQKFLAHIPGTEGNYEEGGAQMTRVCDGKSLPKGDPNKVYLLRVFGGKSHQIFDVTDPAKPVRIWQRPGPLNDTHKSFWECDTGIAYLVSGVPGWRVRRMTEVWDMSDPAHPVKIRDFGLPGQEPGATGSVPTELHGPISLGPQGNRVYFGYGTNKGGIMQIVDRDKLLNGPKEPTPENLRLPEIARMPMSAFNGAHTTFPMPKMPIAEFAPDAQGAVRDIVMVVDEQILN